MLLVLLIHLAELAELAELADQADQAKLAEPKELANLSYPKGLLTSMNDKSNSIGRAKTVSRAGCAGRFGRADRAS